MANSEPKQTKNLDIYGNEALPWSRARAALDGIAKSEHTTWFLGVTDPGGAPHASGVGAMWSDGQLFFVSGPGTRKSKDLAKQPAASLSIGLDGIDLVFEGNVRRVTDSATVQRMAKEYREDGGWPVEATGDAFTAPFSAPSAGPPPWYLYELQYESVYGVATAEPNGATRWKFGGR